MSFGANPTTSTQGALPQNQFPINAVYVPNTANGDLTVVEGILINTDSLGNKSTAVRLGLLDGDDVTLGKKADAAATDSTSAWTAIAMLKGIFAKLAGTLTVGGTVTANQGGSNWSINNAQVAGTTISINQGSVDGGTQRVAQGGAGTGTKTNVASSATSVTILAANTNRKGATIYNDSTQTLYLDLSGGTASNSSYSVQVSPQGYFELPGPAVYNGLITGIWAAANGNARVTEFS